MRNQIIKIHPIEEHTASANLLDISGYNLLRECQMHGISVLNASIFGSGLLWGGDKARLSFIVAPKNIIQFRLYLKHL